MFIASPLHAAPNRPNKPTASNTQTLRQSRTPSFGLGIILFGPNGLTAKTYVDDNAAIDFALSWDLSHWTEMQVDYLWHTLFGSRRGFLLNYYYGIGAHFAIAEDSGEENDNKPNENKIGGRFPLGFNMWLPNLPIETFLEAAIVLNLIPATELKFTAAVGGRYYF